MTPTNLREKLSPCFSTRIEGNLYYWKLPVCIPIIFNVEAVNSQNEGSVRAARWGGVSPAIIPGKRIGRSCRAIPGSERLFSEGRGRRVKRWAARHEPGDDDKPLGHHRELNRREKTRLTPAKHGGRRWSGGTRLSRSETTGGGGGGCCASRAVVGAAVWRQSRRCC